jgi:hypothetical protein
MKSFSQAPPANNHDRLSEIVISDDQGSRSPDQFKKGVLFGVPERWRFIEISRRDQHRRANSGNCFRWDNLQYR